LDTCRCFSRDHHCCCEYQILNHDWSDHSGIGTAHERRKSRNRTGSTKKDPSMMSCNGSCSLN
jgi:hypothetical protein